MFHVLPDGETANLGISDFHAGLVVGVLVGEGSFGGDGKQPQATLRMHTRHAAIFDLLVRVFPSTKVYGPYSHGNRDYLQWMARGRALVAEVLPLLDAFLTPEVDSYAYGRYRRMLDMYAEYIAKTKRSLESR